MELTIRQVKPQDLARCCFIESMCFPPEQAALCESIQKRIELYPEGFLVAEAGGEIIGMVNSGATHKTDIADEEFKAMVGHDSDGVNVVIFSLCVLPQFQGQGIARRLLTEYIASAKAAGKHRVMLICQSELVPYYAKSGFVDVGQSAATHGGTQWQEMHLHLINPNT